MTIIQKNNVVLFSNFETKSFKIWCKNTGNKTVNLEPENCARNLKPPFSELTPKASLLFFQKTFS